MITLFSLARHDKRKFYAPVRLPNPKFVEGVTPTELRTTVQEQTATQRLDAATTGEAFRRVTHERETVPLKGETVDPKEFE